MNEMQTENSPSHDFTHTPNGPRQYLTHTPGNLGWSRIGAALHCSRMAILDQMEAEAIKKQWSGGPQPTPARPFFIGTLVHEALAALFQRLKLVQEGKDATSWIDPWTLLSIHAARHAGTYVARWVDAAANAFTTLAGIPAAGHEEDLPWPQAWAHHPDFRFLALWGKDAQARYRVRLVEEVCSWRVGAQEVYEPRVDLVLEDQEHQELLWIDWKTTSKWHRCHYPPHMSALAEREWKNHAAFYGCSGQFQAMFFLNHPTLSPLSALPRRVLLGNIHIPREMGVIFDPIEIGIYPATSDSLHITLRDTIRFLTQAGPDWLKGLCIPYASHHCVTTYGKCKHYKNCYGRDLTLADGEHTLEEDGEDGGSL